MKEDDELWLVSADRPLMVEIAGTASVQPYISATGDDTHLAHYFLTRDSVYRTLQGGTTLEMVLETLRGGAREALPQNVEREIRAWAEHREQITITTQARLIAFPSPETRALALDAGLPGMPVGETYVLVPPAGQIKAALKAVFGLQLIPTIDYAEPLPPCLAVGKTAP